MVSLGAYKRRQGLKMFFFIAKDALQTDFFGGAKDTKYIISGIECFGNETSISDCAYDNVGGKTCNL